MKQAEHLSASLRQYNLVLTFFFFFFEKVQPCFTWEQLIVNYLFNKYSNIR